MATTQIVPPLELARRRRATMSDPPQGEITLSKQQSVFRNFWLDSQILAGTMGQGDNEIFLNPDPVLRAEGNALGLGVYDELLQNDPHLSGLFHTRINAVVALPWEILPGGTTQRHIDQANLVEQVFLGIPEFDAARRRQMWHLLKGYSIAEIVWGGANGWTVILKLKDHDPRNWLFDRAWRPRMIISPSYYDSLAVDPRKILVLRHDARAWNPYGIGLGQVCYYTSVYKKHVLNYWATYCEKWGQPTVEAIYKNQANADKDAITAQAEEVAWRQAVAHDDSITLQGIKDLARSGDTEAFEKLIKELNDEHSKAVIGQVLAADPRPTGLGSAQAVLQGEVRQDLLQFDAATMEECFNGLARMVCDANYGPQPPNEYPTFKIHAEPAKDTKATADAIAAAVQAGLRVPARWAYEALEIPEPEPGEEVLEKAAPVAPAPFGRPPGGAPRGGAPNTSADNPADPNNTEDVTKYAEGRLVPGARQNFAETDQVVAAATRLIVPELDALQHAILARAYGGKPSGR